MRASRVTIAFAIAIIASEYSGAQSPPPMFARPRAMYYPHGPGSSPIPVTDLYQAIMENDSGEVEGLLRRGANANEPSPPGVFPLIQAMGYQTDPKIAELLIKHGADVNVRTPKNEQGQTNGWSPIFYAIYRKRADLVSVLLKHHAKVTFKDVQGKSPLDWAREVKNAAMVKQIENAGSNHQ